MKQDPKGKKPADIGLDPAKSETIKPVEVQGKNLGGRPSKYTPEILDEICERLSKGEPMAAICREANMPAYRTVKDWMDEDSPRGQAVSAAIARAREDGEDSIAADVLDIVDATPARFATPHGDAIDSGDVANRKMRAEYRLKLLAKWNPKKWGERLELDATVKARTEVILPHVTG